MSVYEQRLTADKAEIRQRVSEIGRRVGTAVASAVQALLQRDEAGAARVMLGDQPVNREIRAIDKLCHAFVARHLPSAGHLRFVSSVLRMDVALERIGDYAVTIAREGVQLSVAPPEPIAAELRAVASQASAVLERAMKAFQESDAALARKTKPEAKDVSRSYGEVYRELMSQKVELRTADSFALLNVFHRLDRVSDQAKNICEETLFEITGETKRPKRYRILFVGAGDTLVAPLAVGLARKAFPESGDYSSAGYDAGAEVSPALARAAADYSLDVSGLSPKPLDRGRDTLERFHVIVCLSQEARKKLDHVPYSAIVLVWELPRVSIAPTDEIDPGVRLLCTQLNAEIHDLIVTLRGDDAN
jgi:phosphate transport system protein